ncbi:Ubiquitin carboxyl-terminal hydrolase 15 [Nosema bombycis CQ1]|uniref:Ubiquitin carboxyl-terminal hydrolase n=1 Tax=Nosema bombycis (strain CQ1 / CVCC 102059) TaxID=578461 RepID=R0KUQ8_NOSB1|nr:Ubiquitin carboxyl-terminal hydrolase 15 [Nosema bombycis CQ1]|eukprot:EOB14601.1 Ubiquitin carboxyl-terminal hydrolase 15 [Nosema bombycis CQ1]
MNFSWKTSCPSKNELSNSKPFTAQGNEWKILISNKYDKIYLSLEYLGTSYFDIFTEYVITVNDKRTVRGNFQFSQMYKDFGFYVDKVDEYNISLSISVLSGHYDSREVTGYVGLRNLGATCYINSFLQTIFNIKKFRADILNCEPVDKILVLQKLFYKMQIEEDPLDTTDFVLSHVWDDNIHLHQDIHEFSKVFFDTIEKESKKKEIIEDLIQGRVTNYIKASCGCTRKIKENFQDIQVEIRDFFNQKMASNLEESFRKYTKPEILNETNKYRCDEHGLVDAEKGVLFSKLPPVLFILLKRFNMDFETGEGYKINDYFEFPDVVDMKPYCDEEDEDTTKDTIYTLYSIVVHKGGHDEGHFYVYICINNQWFKFNDTIVSKVSKEEAMFMNFGGKHPYKKHTKEYSAYYLVYLNKKEIPDLLYREIPIPENVMSAILKKDEKIPVKIIAQDDIRMYNGPGFHNLHTFDYSLTNYKEVCLIDGDDLRVFKNKIEAILNTKCKVYVFKIEDKDEKCSSSELIPFYSGVVDLESNYFVYKSYGDINFNQSKLLFVKIFKDDVWCDNTVPTNLTLLFPIHLSGTLGDNIHSLIEKTGKYNPGIYLESNLRKLDLDFNLSNLKHGDILIVVDQDKDLQFIDFMTELTNRMCINVTCRDNSFTMFIPREIEAEDIEKTIQNYLSDDSIVIVDNIEEEEQFKTANEESILEKNGKNLNSRTLDRNSLAIGFDSDRKLIYLGQSFTHIDYNKIIHVHPFVVFENGTVEDLIKKILVSPFKCFSSLQQYNLQDIRIVDAINGMLYLKSYTLSNKFTSQGMNVIQAFPDKRYIKGAYYIGLYKIIGYPFFIFTDSETIYEFREEFKIFQKLVKFDGNEYRELYNEDRMSMFGDETYLLIETR